MKRLINSMMIHLGQVQLVSDIFLLLIILVSCSFQMLFCKCFVLVEVASVTNLAKYSVLGLRIV